MVVGTIVLCFLAALVEGYDIQSMGVAAPRIAPVLHLGPSEMGFVLSASTLGLMIGAAWGGRASDRVGRKRVLILSLFVFGCFTLLTPLAGGFGSLTALRFLVGLGLGGTLPNLIALATDVSPARHGVTLLGIVYCGLPAGGALTGVVASWLPPEAWRPIFVVGGLAPLILVPLLAMLLPPGGGVVAASPSDDRRAGVLFGGNARRTLLLWTAYFFTLLTVYLLLNWLPTLIAMKGGGPTAGAQAAIFLNAGAIVGSLALGGWSDRAMASRVLTVTYLGMLASLALLWAADHRLAFIACAIAGFFVIGGQLVLYAMAPAVYPSELRGTGVGAAVAAGRAGSIMGPLIGGLLLGADIAVNLLLVVAAPGLLFAFLSASSLARASSAGVTS